MSQGRLFFHTVLLLCVTSLLPADSAVLADGVPMDRPVLDVEKTQELTRVYVVSFLPDGGIGRTLLRESSSGVVPGATGVVPGASASFVTWAETGGGRWFSYSRDGGVTWAESQRLLLELRLRDGAVMPGAGMPTPREGMELPADGRLFIVQFHTIGLPEYRHALAGLDAELLSFLPHNGHIVRMDPGLVQTALALDFVERVEPYHPWYRVEEMLRGWLDSREESGNDTATRRVNVMSFEWGEDGKKRIADAAWSIGAAVIEAWPNGHIVEIELSRDQLRALAAHDDVMWIGPWGEPFTDMDKVREDAGTDFVEDNFGYCGQGVRGEVLDGGTQEDHQDFDGIMIHGGNTAGSHGTSTYGIVFGNGDRDGDGEAKATGHMPCPEAQGIAADFSYLGDRFAHTRELKESPYFASFQTNSWGSLKTTAYTTFSHQMDDIIWRLDIAITQSQSNEGDQNSASTAWAKNIISVGGVNHYNTLDTADDAWDGAGSIGPAEDGRIKPDVCYWYDSIFTTTNGNDYTSGFGGTSAATPETAGIVGLIVQMWADNVWGTDPQGSTVFEKQPHFSTIKALLINNAQQYGFTGQDHDLTRVHQGWGRASAKQAKNRAANSFIVDEDFILELGDLRVFEIDVPPGETELKITMVYPDPPGTISASMHRINNVDLKVTSPSGTVYHGNNGLLDGNFSTPGGQRNEVDTVENVFIGNPASGTWRVEVAAPEINQDAFLDTPEDDLTFALVVTGGTSQLIQPFAGRIKLDAESYSCDSRILVRVNDGNVGASSVTVDIWSDTESTPELLTLTETTPGSGKFSGEIWTSSDAPAAGDGVLSITQADTISAQYIDADDGEGGASVPRLDTAVGDCHEPLISHVDEEDVSDTEATVIWTTSERATSEVIWGEAIPPTEAISELERVAGHAISLAGLTECTVYHYEVRSTDGHGNAAADDNGGNYYHFETMGDFGNGLQPCHAGQVSIDLDAYSCSDTLNFQVVDRDLNGDPLVAETTLLYVSSSSEPDAEIVVATESGIDTATFTGSIATENGVPSADGLLQTSDGDTLTVTYRDKDDGTGATAVDFDVAVADCSGSGIVSITVVGFTDESAQIQVATTERTTVTVDWGETPSLGSLVSDATLSTSHVLDVGTFPECSRFHFTVNTTDAYGNTAFFDAAGAPFEANAHEILGAVFNDGFETDTGWSLQEEWEIDAPQGLGSSAGDPTAAYSGDHVLGHDLNGLGAYLGDYEAGGGSVSYATSPAIDASSLTNGELRLRRWLNVSPRVLSSIEIRSSSGVWSVLWVSDDWFGHAETNWSLKTYDISEYADGNSQLRIRFKQTGGTSTSYHRPGWNVDRFVVRDGSLPEYGVCGGCGGTPAFAGALSAVDNDSCGATGATVSWKEAAAWGTGGGGSYAVYRDNTPGFTPSAGNLVASGITALFYDDTTAPVGAQLYYLVRAENDETCASGPANGGVTDGGAVYVAVTDTSMQPVPGVIDDLALGLVNSAHLRLEWTALADAATYNVYRATEPKPGGFLRLGETQGTVFDDESSGANANTYYYLVRAANACGEEGE